MSEAECWAVGVSNLLWLVLGVIVAALAFMLSCAKGCKPVVICQQGSAHCQRILEECPALRNKWVTHSVIVGEGRFFFRCLNHSQDTWACTSCDRTACCLHSAMYLTPPPFPRPARIPRTATCPRCYGVGVDTCRHFSLPSWEGCCHAHPEGSATT